MSKPLRISKTSKKLIDAMCETANHAGVQEICGQNTIAQRRFDNAKEDLECRLIKLEEQVRRLKAKVQVAAHGPWGIGK